LFEATFLILGISSGPALIESPGPLSPLYLQDNNTRWIWAIQGPEANQLYFNASNYQSAIVVRDTIRTAGAYPQNVGYEINLSGQLIQQLPQNGSGFGFIGDGATDGQFNYTIDGVHERVLRFNGDWTNPSEMFDLPPGFNCIGITWDAHNDSFWVASHSSQDFSIHNFTRSGQLLSSFLADAGIPPGDRPITFLAMDPVDGTLWMGRQTTGYLLNYKPTGEYLGTSHYAQLSTSNTLGGEFQIVPAPAGLMLIAMASCRRSRRRHLD